MEKVEIDKQQLKEERRTRNRQKREAKKLEKQKAKLEVNNLYKISPQGSNVSLITRQFADIATGLPNDTEHSRSVQELNLTDDFPLIGETKNVRTNKNNVDDQNENTEKSSKNETIKKSRNSCINIEIVDLLQSDKKPAKSHSQYVSQPNIYHGNPLDSSHPKRKAGKHKENSLIKKESKLKKAINKEHAELDNENSTFTLLRYSNNAITPELENATKLLLTKIVSFQERLYKKNPLKGQIKRRYVVGFHEVKKYLKLGKVKMLVIATDIKVLKENDTLHSTIKEITEIGNKEGIDYFFALTRRKLGNITLKHMPVSCIGILNFDGAQEEYKVVLEEFRKVKEPSDEISMEPLSSIINNVISTLKNP